MNVFALVALAVVAGLAVTLQGQFMGLMSKAMGTVESVFITYGSGAIVIALVMLLLRGGKLRQFQEVPWYAYTAGICGLVIVGGISYIVPRLGLVAGFTILIAAQFGLAALFDHFGLFGASLRPLDAGRLLGLVVMLLGVWLVVRQ
jgi:bacterial/archaeal transporter family-2 protein